MREGERIRIKPLFLYLDTSFFQAATQLTLRLEETTIRRKHAFLIINAEI